MKPPMSVLVEAVADHYARGRGRVSLRVPGFSRQEIVEEWNRQTRGLPRRGVKVAKSGPDGNEDGLDRLRRKRQLDANRLAQAERYRKLGRLALTIGGSVKSCLNSTPGGIPKGLPESDAGMAAAVDAKRELLWLRSQVLMLEEDMIAVLDGVCIGGLTVRAMAGGDGNRARELLAILKVALQLLHLQQNPPSSALDGGVQKAA